MNFVNTWMQYLNWAIFPDFNSIYRLEKKMFEACYYQPESVTEVINEIEFYLQADVAANMTLKGAVGSGKTTFVYFLKHILSKKKSLLNKYHVEILHFQRMLSSEKADRHLIEERTVHILQNYFSANELQHEFDIVTKNRELKKDMINALEDFIVEEKKRFKKRLIIVLDDVDETDESIVEPTVRYFYSLLECEQIVKWLVARETTLNNYHESFLAFIETKFSKSIVFPRVDLHGIVAKRISAYNPSGLNPFIWKLCLELLLTYNFDLRVSLANISSFFMHLKPPKTAVNNPMFAGEFFETNFTTVMTKIGAFPNIYKDTADKMVPLEKDIFLLLATKKRFTSGDLPRLVEQYKLEYDKIWGGLHSGDQYMISIDMDHVRDSIDYLINQRLVVPHSKVKDFYKLTCKGESFVKFVTEKVYTRYCKNVLKEVYDKKHPVFWELAERFPTIEV